MIVVNVLLFFFILRISYVLIRNLSEMDQLFDDSIKLFSKGNLLNIEFKKILLYVTKSLGLQMNNIFFSIIVFLLRNTSTN